MFGLPMHCERLCFLDYALTKFIGISHKRMMMVVHIVPPKKGVFSAEIEGLLFQDKTGAMHSCAPKQSRAVSSTRRRFLLLGRFLVIHRTQRVTCSCACTGCHKVNGGKLLGD